jgi:hypothetical protein
VAASTVCHSRGLPLMFSKCWSLPKPRICLSARSRALSPSWLSFDQPHAPYLQVGPFLGSMGADACRLKQIGSQQTVSPSRDLAVDVGSHLMLASRRDAAIGADFGCRTGSRRVIDRAGKSALSDIDPGIEIWSDTWCHRGDTTIITALEWVVSLFAGKTIA